MFVNGGSGSDILKEPLGIVC